MTQVHKGCYPVAVKTIDGRNGLFMCNACEMDKERKTRPEDRG